MTREVHILCPPACAKSQRPQKRATPQCKYYSSVKKNDANALTYLCTDHDDISIILFSWCKLFMCH